MNYLHIDFETRSRVDIKKAGADVYARDRSTEALCLAFSFDDGPVELWKKDEPAPIDVFLAIEDGFVVVGHNVAFELAVWNHTQKGHGWPPLQAKQTLCTMAMAYAMALPGSLANAAAAAGIKYQKDMPGHRVMMQLSQPRKENEDGSVTWWTPEESPEKFEKLYSYCINDIQVERELFKRLMKLSPRETEIWLLDYKINQRGVQVDLPAVRKAIEIVNIEKKRLDDEMRLTTKGAVSTCSATGQLTDWLRYRGFATEGVAKADVTGLLEKKLPQDVRSALLLRQEAAKSSTAKLEAMAVGTCEDGRARGLFQYHGASTGRWAGRRIQLQNLPRPNLKQEEVEGVFGVIG